MKLSIFCLTLIAGAQAFQPTHFQRSPFVVLLQSNDENMLDKAGAAINEAANAIQNAVGDAGDSGPPSGLSQKEQEMWEAQRALQENRNKHSSKEGRHQKYSGQPVIENDKHDELEKPWTKSDEADDHYSVNRKL